MTRCTSTFLLPKGWKQGSTREVRCCLDEGHRGAHVPGFEVAAVEKEERVTPERAGDLLVRLERAKAKLASEPVPTRTHSEFLPSSDPPSSPGDVSEYISQTLTFADLHPMERDDQPE